MLRKLSPVDLIAAIKALVEKNTGLPFYDAVPDNAPAPFYFGQLVSTTPGQAKTMWVETYTVWIHAIAKAGDSSVQIYDLITKLNEAMTQEIILPEGYELLLQTDQGMQNLQTDETGEKHAVLAYDFRICYGFKSKI